MDLNNPTGAGNGAFVDLHCHVAGVGAGGSGCRVSDRLRGSFRYRAYLRAFGVSEAELREHGDALVVRRVAEGLGRSRLVGRAVVLALDGAVDGRGELDPDRTEVMIPDEWLGREVRAHPNLLFGASVNPLRRDALERLDRAAADGAVLVKWLPPIQGMDPADRRFIPFYERLCALDLPLLVHTGHERSFSASRDELGDPARLRLPLEVGVRVVAAHGAASGKTGGQPNWARLLPLFAAFPRLFADVSSLTQANHFGALRRLLRRADLHERLLYGTDMPLLATPLVSPLFFAPRLGLRRTQRLLAVANPWDRDVELKRALGVPEAVFARTAQWLGVG